LSATAVETLAIIAYKQPITKVEVEFIRGVNVDYIMKTLLEKDLIYISGRAHSPGRPLLYGTTPKFLEHFGLNEITDLPKPREIQELIGETEAEVDRRILAEQQQLEFKEELEEKLEGHEGAKQKPKETKQPRIASMTPREMAEQQNIENRKKKTEETKADETTEVKEAEHPAPFIEEENIERTAETVAAPNEPELMTPAAEEDAPVVHFSEKEKIEEGESSLENIGKIKTEEKLHQTIVEQEHLAHQSQTSDAEPVQEASEETVSTIASKVLPVTDEPIHSAISEEDFRTNGEPAEPVKRPLESLMTEERDGEIRNEELHQTDEERQSYPENRDRFSDQQTEQFEGRQTGWSKWKNKVKTFFQKLFG
ncbi:MAG: SMC-Scp complex subunit ScpB, partial [Bacteroidota bacterium]|nr:SMC-Scp complex subunit ScpB [Bacteroidota bacterium]